MDEKFQKKYNRVLEILSNVAACADRRLILIGGTALSLFYLKHRVSVDIDLAPITGKEKELKEAVKGCLSKKGYTTIRTRYENQFVVQFEDTGIKIEIFTPNYKIKKTEEFEFGNAKLLVASIDDILELKLISYRERKAARDLFDLIKILEFKKQGLEITKQLIKQLIKQCGPPEDKEEIAKMAYDKKDYELFLEVVKNAP